MAKEFRGEIPGKPQEPSGENRLFKRPDATLLLVGILSEVRLRKLEAEKVELGKHVAELHGKLAEARENVNPAPESVNPVHESFEDHSESSREFRKEQISEAKEDYDQVIRRELEDLRRTISRLSDETAKNACLRQVDRIKNGIEKAIGSDADAQAYTLNIVNNYLFLTSTAQSADVKDEEDRALVDQIGDTLESKLAPQIWAVLSKLGRVQEWTVSGDVTFSLFGMVKGKTGLSMTFTR